MLKLLTIKAVAEMLGCSWRTIHRLADRGEFPPGIKIGGMRRWTVESVESYIAARETGRNVAGAR